MGPGKCADLQTPNISLMAIHLSDTVLDVGCGTGDDLRKLADMVGPTGRVVGVDSSETMVREARARTEGLPVECRVGDAHHLEFAANTFDACRSELVFQHLEEPQQAFAELVRVARPGARIVVFDPDWDTLVVDAGDKELTRRLVTLISDNHRNGWMGRQLRTLALQSGLVDVSVAAFTVIITEWPRATQVLGFECTTQEAVSAGIVSSGEATAWLHDLEERARAGLFFSACTAFGVSSRKP